MKHVQSASLHWACHLVHPQRLQALCGLQPEDLSRHDTLCVVASGHLLSVLSLPPLPDSEQATAWRGAVRHGWSATLHVSQWLQQALLARWVRLCIGGRAAQQLRAALGSTCHVQALREWASVEGWRPPQQVHDDVLAQSRACSMAVLAMLVRQRDAAMLPWWQACSAPEFDLLWQAPEQGADMGQLDAIDWALLDRQMQDVFKDASPLPVNLPPEARAPAFQPKEAALVS